MKGPWPLFVGGHRMPSTVVTVSATVQVTSSYGPLCPAPALYPGPLGPRGHSGLPTFPAFRLGAWCGQPGVWPALPASSLTPSGAASPTADPPQDVGSAQREESGWCPGTGKHTLFCVLESSTGPQAAGQQPLLGPWSPAPALWKALGEPLWSQGTDPALLPQPPGRV